MSTELLTEDQFELIRKMTRDLMRAADLLDRNEARYLVDVYYQIQDFRMQAASQARTSGDGGEPNAVVQWLFETLQIAEKNIQNALGRFARQYTVGQWLQSLTGIGPVISAGLLAHLDVRGRPHAGHFWSFAGLINEKWEKKTKRPWNAKLKVLLWKVGESFVKTQNLESDYYGHLFAMRKSREWEWNFEGRNVEACRQVLAEKNFSEDAIAKRWYSGEFAVETVREWLAKEGRSMAPPSADGLGLQMLPPAHVHARARRWVEKLFLSHVHHVMFEDLHGFAPDKPYAFERLKNEDHRHYLEPPGWPTAKRGKSLAQMFEEATLSDKQGQET